MQLEQQVVSLDLAMKLRVLGFNDSYFVWHVGGRLSGEKTKEILTRERPETFCTADSAYSDWPAYTVAELGNMFEKIGADLFIKSYGEVFDFKGTSRIGELGIINLTRKSDMLAKMLIYLKENNLI